jgi:hypothetical protein
VMAQPSGHVSLRIRLVPLTAARSYQAVSAGDEYSLQFPLHFS